MVRHVASFMLMLTILAAGSRVYAQSAAVHHNWGYTWAGQPANGQTMVSPSSASSATVPTGVSISNVIPVHENSWGLMQMFGLFGLDR